MNWGPFIYQYLVGGLIFFIGFGLVWRSGDLSWKRREDRLTTIFVLIMFFAYLIGQFLWQLYGLGII